MRRVGLFLLTNLAVILVLGTVLRLLGVDHILEARGGALNYTNLLIFAAVFGFGGAFISLAISKWMAKRSTGAEVIEQPRNETERWLLAMVQRQAQQAGIKMPEVAIFPSPEPNAFATGMNKNAALVAVSSGLLQTMSRDEVEAVLGHEIAHVANGDMVTLALVQGVVNTFVIFIARVIGHTVDRVVFKNEDGPGIAYWQFAGRGKMIAALERLRSMQPQPLPGELAAFGIAGNKAGLMALFASHPPLEDRIAALRQI